MASTDPEEEPILHPWVVHAMRVRPKLVAENPRNKLLKNVEENIMERRKPENIADRLSRRGLQDMADFSQPVVRDVARDRFVEANKNVASKL